MLCCMTNVVQARRVYVYGRIFDEAGEPVELATVNEEHTTLPIGGMSIEDFAKLVAKYVVEEIISRIK